MAQNRRLVTSSRSGFSAKTMCLLSCGTGGKRVGMGAAPDIHTVALLYHRYNMAVTGCVLARASSLPLKYTSAREPLLPLEWSLKN